MLRETGLLMLSFLPYVAKLAIPQTKKSFTVSTGWIIDGSYLSKLYLEGYSTPNPKLPKVAWNFDLITQIKIVFNSLLGRIIVKFVSNNIQISEVN